MRNPSAQAPGATLEAKLHGVFRRPLSSVKRDQRHRANGTSKRHKAEPLKISDSSYPAGRPAVAGIALPGTEKPSNQNQSRKIPAKTFVALRRPESKP
jgi:hypothetical protein